jgi:hypothetical protein
MSMQSKIQAAENYAVGAAAITSPAWMTAATDTVHFLTVLIGLVLVSVQLYRTLKKK